MLPKFQTAIPELTQLQTRWSAEIDPLLRSPFTNGRLIKSVALVAGANVVNHGLGRALQGWLIVRQRAQATWIYDTQDTNTIPALTLQLESSDPVTVDLWVF